MSGPPWDLISDLMLILIYMCGICLVFLVGELVVRLVLEVARKAR